MNRNKKQLYFTFAEQEIRLKAAMKDVHVQLKHFREAKKKGPLKIDSVVQQNEQLFDV